MRCKRLRQRQQPLRDEIILVVLILLLGAPALRAQDATFQGNTVRIVVGLAAGGGFDAYARAIARHIGKRIDGHPSVIVENMPGAGSLIAANHVYRVAKPNGRTIGHFLGGLFFNQLFGLPGIEFDARKFAFLDFDPMGADELQKQVAAIFSLKPATVDKLRDVLK
jgi:tripartite-type tricarboxylate transporter receptor subunit TctC